MPNQIIVENWQGGTSDWRISNPSLAGEIEGFLSMTSALPGETINFFVSTKMQSFSIQIFRMGWYGGAGGRLMKTVPMLWGIDQSSVHTIDDTFGTVNCTNWKQSYSLQIPDDWVSGIYLVKLSTGPDAPSLERHMVFVVKSNNSSDLLWVSPTNTYQAYNGWDGGLGLGASLYDNFATGSNAGKHVNAVSFNRPYADGLGAGNFLNWEYPMLFLA